ncbi:MAG TPA: PKD domain-containing protein, partial [Candidatus Thermoplasmatota archaeon]|nr:PKD domain-containing protein [Candidatus Thermoplasmatota archaeon]
MARALATLALAALLLAAWPLTGAPAAAAPGLEAPALVQDHAPIRIDSDADLDAAHGVRGGSGAPGDPFLISSWRIADQGVHVRIGNVTKAVMLRNLDLAGACDTAISNCTLEAGIHVINATGGVSIVHNRITNMERAGISVFDARGAQVLDNIVEGGGTVRWLPPPSPPGGAGIILLRCDGALVAHNRVVDVGAPNGLGSTAALRIMLTNRPHVAANEVHGATEFALSFVGVHALVAEDNEITDNANGTAFQGLDGVFRYNNVSNNRQYGLLIAATDGWLRAESNDIRRNGGGVEVRGPANATLRQNNIEENTDFGLSVTGDAHADALENWWGNASGPNVAGQGPGTGQPILLIQARPSQAVFDPWLTLRVGQAGAGASRPGAGVVAQAQGSTGPAPTAVLEGPRLIPVGSEASFSGARSSDPEGGPLQYGWTFGDNASASGVAALHTFDATGEVVVSLKVTDDQGLSSTAQVAVQVVRLPLGVELSANPTTVRRGVNVNLSASATGQPEGPVQFRFTALGPGTFEGAAGAANTTTVAFTETGVHFVGVEATSGAERAVAFDRVVVENAPPTAAASVEPKQGDPTTTFTFTAAESADPDGDALSYHWDFGGAEAAEGPEVTRSFAAPGTHLAVLTVSDGAA